MKRRQDRLRAGLILAVIAVALIVVMPLLHHGFFVSDDGDWMIIRLSAFFQSLRQGQFPVRYLGRLNHNYGYPVADFLYPGFLYLGSLIHILGVSFTDSVKIMLIGSVAVIAGASFLWLLRRYNPLPAFAGTVSILMAPYLSFDMFKRGSVGEILGLAAGVVALYAIDGGFRILTVLATALLTVSHNTIALLFLSVLGLYALVRRQWHAVFDMTIGIGAAAFFWVPALYDQRYVVFGNVSVSNPFVYFAYGKLLYLLGLPTVACLVLLLFFRRKKHLPPATSFFAYVFAAAVFFASPVSAPVWSLPVLSRLVQFPYRFLSLSAVAGGILVAALVDAVPRFKTAAAVVIVAVFALQWAVTRPKITVTQKPDGFYSTNEATTTVADEYMPKWARTVMQTRANAMAEFLDESGTVTPLFPGTDRLYFDVYSENGGKVRINKIFYPGWGVTIDGKPQQITYANEFGLMDITVTSGSHTVRADFRETPFRFTVDVASVLVLVGGIAYILYAERIRSKRRSA